MRCGPIFGFGDPWNRAAIAQSQESSALSEVGTFVLAVIVRLHRLLCEQYSSVGLFMVLHSLFRDGISVHGGFRERLGQIQQQTLEMRALGAIVVIADLALFSRASIVQSFPMIQLSWFSLTKYRSVTSSVKLLRFAWSSALG
jgi:hypothetical protein